MIVVDVSYEKVSDFDLDGLHMGFAINACVWDGWILSHKDL